MSLGKAIIGGLLFGTTGFIIGAMLGNDEKEVVNINVKQPTAQIVKKPTIEDEFYDKLNDPDFESLVSEYCYENELDIDDLSGYTMEELMLDYNEMLEKGFM